MKRIGNASRSLPDISFEAKTPLVSILLRLVAFGSVLELALLAIFALALFEERTIWHVVVLAFVAMFALR